MFRPVELKTHHATTSIIGGTRVALIGLVASLGLAACGGSSGGNDNNGDPGNPVTTTTSGNAQKGPLQAGGTAGAARLQADGSLAGASVFGDISSRGGFTLSDIDWAGPTQLEMSGAFFNEITGNFTMGNSSNTTLNAAITLPGDVGANVNLFTHFTAARTQHLMAAGTDFTNAREQARSELAAIVGINAAPTSLDLLQDSSINQNDSANLLLFSAATLTAGAGQAGIDAIAADFADDGQVNGAAQTQFDDIKQAAKDNPNLLTTVRTSMQAQYGVVPPDNTVSVDPVWVPGAPALPVASFTFNGSLKTGDTQSFDADNSTGDTLTYSWTFGDGETATGTQAAHVYTDAGNYTVTLTVTDKANRIDTETRELAVTEGSTVPTPPVAAFNVSGDQRANQTLTFSAGDSMGANLTYAWTFGDGNMDSGIQVTHAYPSAGDYSVELTVTDSASQTNTTTQSLTITAQPGGVQKVFASNLTDNDSFGVSVAMEGDIAVIGAEFADIDQNGSDKGAAYVFTNVDGVWSESQKLTASDRTYNDYFGRSVALDGDTIVVGAYNADNNGINSTGAVYVFTRSADGAWSQQAKLVADDAVLAAHLGSSVAIDGDTVLSGAEGYYKNGDGLAGAAYVFTRSGNVWSQQAKFTGNAGTKPKLARFGNSVALTGDTAMVGARGTSFNSSSEQGAVYVFTRSNDSWNEGQTLVASDGSRRESFGYSVSISGETAVVGASRDNEGYGAAYVFNRTGGTWNQSQKLTASDGVKRDVFGSAVAIANDTIIVGAGFGDAYALQSGVAYVFTQSAGTWSEQTKIWAADADQDDRFGYAVTATDTSILIGAYTSPASSANQEPGKAYFYNASDVISP
jgi:PKD repeat protein